MQMTDTQVDFPLLATPEHRLGAVAVDIGLIFATSFIGWGIWSLIVWGRGQTPGKQLLKVRVLNEPTGKPATWGQMLIRQILIGWALAAPYTIAFLFNYLNFSQAAFIGISACLILLIVLHIVDIVWVFGPTHRRLIDYWAGTIVVNEAR
jgi:uncharacterized RDD family membrane protein YckC